KALSPHPPCADGAKDCTARRLLLAPDLCEPSAQGGWGARICERFAALHLTVPSTQGGWGESFRLTVLKSRAVRWLGRCDRSLSRGLPRRESSLAPAPSSPPPRCRAGRCRASGA